MEKIFDLKFAIGTSNLQSFLKLAELSSLYTIANGQHQIVYKDFFLNRISFIKNKDLRLYNYFLDKVINDSSFQDCEEIVL